MGRIVNAEGVNHERGLVTAAYRVNGEPLRVQLADEQIKLLAAGVLAREAGRHLVLGTTEPSRPAPTEWCPVCRVVHASPVGERTDAGVFTKACPKVATWDPIYYDGTNRVYTGDRG